MANSAKTVTEADLQSYVDNRLNRLRGGEVEKFLFENPVIKTELREYQLFNRSFHHMFDAVLEERLPKRLLQFDQVQSQKKRRFSFAQAAMVLLALMVGLVSGWFGRAEFGGVAGDVAGDSTLSMVREAFSYHAVYTPEVRHPVEVESSQQGHLVAWLSKRLKTRVTAPELSKAGFKLLGGRLLSSGNSPAAQFMYENSKGQRVTLFTRKRQGGEVDSAFRYASKGRVNGFYWTDSDLSFVLISDIPKNEISNLAHVVYEKLNK
jgi:anti-sigma factor RsiW